MTRDTGPPIPSGRPAGDVAVLGVAPHSGWAAVVALRATPAGLQVLARSRIEMADPQDPESKHPYHAVEGLDVEEATLRLARFRAAAQDKAHAALAALSEDLARRGYRAALLGVPDSASRRPLPLASILASHALIHAAEGDHFREALVDAAERNGLAVSRIKARELEARAEVLLGRPISELREVVKELGRQVGPPWGADQKTAALLAWLLLIPSP